MAVTETVAPPDADLSPGELLPAGRRFRVVLVLGLLTALGPLTIDMYLPALPTITDDLAATAAAVQLTLTGTLVGIALGQLLVGPLSDAVGRRVPLLVGVGVHVLASVLCVVAPTLAVLGALRVVQGLGAAAASVVAMAIVRDLFSGLAAARLFSRLMLVVGVAPILAPTIGGQVLQFTSWRGVFVVLTLVAAAILASAAVVVPDTLPVAQRRNGGIVGTFRDYGGLLTDRVFVGLILVSGLAMAALIAYVSGSSYVLQDGFGLSEQQFAFVFAGGAVGLIGATQCNVRLLRRWTQQQILAGSLLAGLASGLVLLILAVTEVGGLVGILVPLWLVLAMVGLVMPNAPALALSRHGEVAGTAAALFGAVQFGVGALAAPLVGVLGIGAVAMAVVVFGGMLAAALVCFLVVRPHRLPAEQVEPVAVAGH
ncbi:multidrug effflux MFS transporter [Couchioplanes caeruleus]|uniref:DHA1 family bicyclomycin/chloramphenicol resistance-like MFS transporter n=1 Tax=Couchioplanes caeruleus TaxID=56438 RepID=A0A3N1GBD6_9ACTN|nr:multidrug effflux MFS transporter [Couchioplanes caeruleus]ROP27556.1 DHA1 family bicyclomycin/chloramphenicol resistance-like MFS transporter [Couchioplanes caeruleus]